MSNSPLKSLTSDQDKGFLLALALTTFAVHLLATALGAYGYFRDELYYLACTEHLDIGYVDQPPFSIYVLAVNRLLFGDSLVALRLLPAAAHAATVFLTGLMARELGGNRFAQLLAAFASLVSPIYMGMNGIFSMNCFDILVWAAATYVMILMLKADLTAQGAGGGRTMSGARYWLLLGVILGIGLLNKISILWLGAGIAIGFLLTPHRTWLKTPWPWMAGGVAVLLFLPYIIWNLQHDFAHLEFIRNASGGKYASLTPWSFIAGQMILQNPLSFPVWMAGLISLLFGKTQRTFRPLGIIYVVSFLILILNGHTKAEYLSASYGMLFAGGGVAIERFIIRRGWGWLRPTSLAALIISGCVLAPFTIPLLPVETFIRYQAALGVAPSTPEGKQLDKLPQFYADMFGWEEKAAAVARVFHSLAPDEQAHCAIFADNYGRCGAIDFFGPRNGLPKSIGNHNSYWIWGPRRYTGETMILLGGNPEDDRRYFEEVQATDSVSCTYCMPYENHLTITVCRKPREPMREIWPRIRHYE